VVPRGARELGDEDAVGVTSGTMILIDFDRIEHAYGNSKSAGGFRAKRWDVGRQ
jgi:hypothetical protein